MDDTEAQQPSVAMKGKTSSIEVVLVRMQSKA